jgi:DNA-binding CsgD family transcriptional regulator
MKVALTPKLHPVDMLRLAKELLTPEEFTVIDLHSDGILYTDIAKQQQWSNEKVIDLLASANHKLSKAQKELHL